MLKLNENGAITLETTVENAWTICSKAIDTNTLHELPTEVLEAAMETWEYLDFIAEMSDDYATTRREQAENYAIGNPVREELKKRNS